MAHETDEHVPELVIDYLEEVGDVQTLKSVRQASKTCNYAVCRASRLPCLSYLRMLATSPDARSLVLTRRWPSAMVLDLCEALGKLQKLCMLDLRGSPPLCDRILNSLARLTSLASLHLSASPNHTYSPVALRSMVESLPELSELTLGAEEDWASLSIASLMRLTVQHSQTLASQRAAVKALLCLSSSLPPESFSHDLGVSPVPASRLCGLLVSGVWGANPPPERLPAITSFQGHVTDLTWELCKKGFGSLGGLWGSLRDELPALYGLINLMNDPKVMGDVGSAEEDMETEGVHRGLAECAVAGLEKMLCHLPPYEQEGPGDIETEEHMQALLSGICNLMEQLPVCLADLPNTKAGMVLHLIVACNCVRLFSLRVCAVRSLALFMEHFGTEGTVAPESATQFFSPLVPMLSGPPGQRDALRVLVRLTKFRKEAIAANAIPTLAELLAEQADQMDPGPDQLDLPDLAACGVVSLASCKKEFQGDPCAVAALLGVLRAGLDASKCITGWNKTPMALRLPALKALLQLLRTPGGAHDAALRDREAPGALMRQLGPPGTAAAEQNYAIRLALSFFAGRSLENAKALIGVNGGRVLLLVAARGPKNTPSAKDMREAAENSLALVKAAERKGRDPGPIPAFLRRSNKCMTLRSDFPAPSGQAGKKVHMSELPQDACSTLFIKPGCLPADISRREVGQIFRIYKGFQSVRLIVQNSKLKPGEKQVLGYIEFANVECATAAMAALQGYVLDLKHPDGSVLRLAYARAANWSSLRT